MICEKEKCTGCRACYSICPNGAIIMQEDENGFLYPKINENKCIKCNKCRQICPVLHSKEENKDIVAYACYNKNLTERLNSSSGGIFVLLATEIIRKKGIVFGACFDKNFNVYHVYVDNEEDIYKLMGSKYVQSDIRDTYKKAKEFLDNDKYVLFTGTPCQIEGLNAFLGKAYSKLYTQDLICHGVPSPKVWRSYLKYRKKIDKEAPNNINFRSKNTGWKEYEINFKYKRFQYHVSHNEDYFMQAFLKDACLRESCHQCAFKKKYRNSDITLGDFWGIENMLPNFYDNKGTSLVILNSDNGNKLFEKIKNKIEYGRVDVDKAIEYNSAFIKSAKKDPKREKFMKHVENEDFKKVLKKYTYNLPLYKRILKKIYFRIKNRKS